MTFELPDLPYPTDALEPVIDKETMALHHGKHHATYVSKLNKAIENTEFEDRDLDALLADIDALPADARTAVRNNGGGHWNHSRFWEWLAPRGRTGDRSPELQQAIERDLGGLERMKEDFQTAAGTLFGSGWVWIIVTAAGKLEITTTPNQDNPLMEGIVQKTGTPILGLDVWEHAYYLKYQNKRPEYAKAWWDVVNWTSVSESFARARAGARTSEATPGAARS